MRAFSGSEGGAGISDAAEVKPLLEAPGGVPPVTDTTEALAEVTARLAAGSGPVAADAERASGYRYGQHAELVQLHRRGAGTVLLDARSLPHLHEVGQALGDCEWVFHAASQDLACLREVGLCPQRLFDTELASRLLGQERVSLAHVVARTLGLGLAKEHSAVDWSRRPLPETWLNYAALDVAVLLEVRDVLERELSEAGKLELARQEFQAVLTAPPPLPRADPWRRTSGIHRLRDPRSLAVVRSLWFARDAKARQMDSAPGRVLNDDAIIAAALALPTHIADLLKIRSYSSHVQRPRARYWFDAISQAMALPRSDLPSGRGPKHDGPPPLKVWAKRNPIAWARMSQVKKAVADLSAKLAIPVDNLFPPEGLRQVVWAAPRDVPGAMARVGARRWQVGELAPIVERAIAENPA
jgi:ribonuclease D